MPVLALPGRSEKRFRPVKTARKSEQERCHWAQGSLLTEYHDNEWGVPIHDDRRLFEFLILEGAQAGLSWETILKKRENYRRAFDSFDAARISRYNAAKVRQPMKDSGIVRNRLKIAATISNARAFLAVQKEFGTFDRYIWTFAPQQAGARQAPHRQKVVTRTPESDAMSKDLKKRGFRFTGTTICYAFMQAVGMVNDHASHCFRAAVSRGS